MTTQVTAVRFDATNIAAGTAAIFSAGTGNAYVFGVVGHDMTVYVIKYV